MKGRQRHQTPTPNSRSLSGWQGPGKTRAEIKPSKQRSTGRETKIFSFARLSLEELNRRPMAGKLLAGIRSGSRFDPGFLIATAALERPLGQPTATTGWFVRPMF